MIRLKYSTLLWRFTADTVSARLIWNGRVGSGCYFCKKSCRSGGVAECAGLASQRQVTLWVKYRQTWKSLVSSPRICYVACATYPANAQANPNQKGKRFKEIFSVERRSGRVVEGNSLENCRTWKGIVSSNLTSSAQLKIVIIDFFIGKLCTWKGIVSFYPALREGQGESHRFRKDRLYKFYVRITTKHFLRYKQISGHGRDVGIPDFHEQDQ